MVISDNESELLMRWEIVSIYFNVVIELIQRKLQRQIKLSKAKVTIVAIILVMVIRVLTRCLITRDIYVDH